MTIVTFSQAQGLRRGPKTRTTGKDLKALITAYQDLCDPMKDISPLAQAHGFTQTEFLLEAINTLGYSRAQLAQRLGVSVRTISKWLSPQDAQDYRAMGEMAWKYLAEILAKLLSVQRQEEAVL